MDKISIALTICTTILVILTLVFFFKSPVPLTNERLTGLGMYSFVVFCIYIKLLKKQRYLFANERFYKNFFIKFIFQFSVYNGDINDIGTVLRYFCICNNFNADVCRYSDFVIKRKSCYNLFYYDFGVVIFIILCRNNSNFSYCNYK